MSSKKIKKVLEKRTTEIALLVIAVSLIAAATQASDVLDAGNPTGDLEAHYKFDEGAGGTAYDYSNNSNDASLRPDLSSGPNWNSGRNGKVLEFDGSDDFATGPDALGSSEEVTISVWAKADSTGTDDPIVSLHEDMRDDGTDSHVGFRYDDSGSTSGNNDIIKVSMNDTDGDRGNWEFGDNIQTSGEWTHWVVTFDTSDNDPKLYKNGREINMVGSGATPADVDTTLNTDTFDVGRGGHTGYWDGQLDDVRIYSKALNQSQVKALYSGGSYSTGQEANETGGKVLDISFDKWNSTHVFDTSGNRNHATPTYSPEQLGAWKCQTGRCYQFGPNQNGETDRAALEVGSDPADFSGKPEFTVMFWTNWDYQDGKTDVFLDNLNGGDGGWSVDSGYNIKNIQFDWENSTGTFKGISIGDVKDDKWQHITFRGNGTHVIGYRDGVRKDMTKMDIDFAPNPDGHPLTIGRGEGDWGNGVEGSMDEVKIFNSSLSQKQIIEEAGIEQSGAVLDMRFDEGAGPTAYDSSSYGNDGSLKNGTESCSQEYCPMWKDGVMGNAVDFDGEWEKVAVSDDSSIDISDETISVAAWIRIDNVGKQKHHTIVDKGVHTDSSSYSFLTDNDAGNELMFRINGATGDVVSSYTPPEGEWTHVAATANGTHITIYANGRPVHTEANSETIETNNNDLYIGNAIDRGDDHQFNGSIDQVKIYPYAISDSKVKELYRRGSSQIGGKTSESRPSQAPPEDELVGEWSFDSGNSTHTFDSSGMVRHGRLQNEPETSAASDCRVGSCFEFDNSNDGLLVSDEVSFQKNRSATLSFWAAHDKKCDGTYCTMYSESGSGDGAYFAVQYEKSDPKLNLHSNQASGDGPFGGIEKKTSFTIPFDGSWHHYLINHSGQNYTVYVDGEKVGGWTNVGFTTGATETNIGERQPDNNFQPIVGRMDQVRIFNKSLKMEEIWYLYSKGRDRSSEGEMAGPVAWYRMDNDSGQTVYDYSGEGLYGTRGTDSTDEGSDPVWNPSCKINGCLDFDGSKARVNITSSNSAHDRQVLSVSAWVRYTSSTFNQFDKIVGNGEFDSKSGWMLQGNNQEDEYEFSVFDGSSEYKITTKGFDLTKWHHVTGTHNGTHQRIFVDGELAASAKNDITIDYSSGWFTNIGASPKIADYKQQWWDGRIDDVRIYPYALTQAQVKQVMNSGAARVG